MTWIRFVLMLYFFVVTRWTEYCSELYNHKADGNLSVLNCTQADTEDDHPILRREVEYDH